MEINYSKLIEEGSLEVSGHLSKKECHSIMDKVWDDSMLTIVFFLFRKEDGFARDTTNIYITDRNASFRPVAHFWKAYIWGYPEDKEAFFALTPLEIKPMTMREYIDLVKILKG